MAPITRRVRRASLGLATVSTMTAGLVLVGGALAGPAQAGAELTPQADKAAGWLAGHLQDGLLRTRFQGQSFANYSSSLDTALAFQELETRGKRRGQILDAIEADPDAYVAAFGTVSGGAIGKLLTAVQQEGITPKSYADGQLLPRLEATVTKTGEQTGRVRDTGGTTDTSNTVKQSFAVRALALAGDGLADEAVGFLLEQQCAGGYFRLFEESADSTCDGGTASESAPSVDATSFAVLALVQARNSDVRGVQAQVHAALEDAVRWLLSRQGDNGSFKDAGVRNSNSTGTAAQALAATGHRARAQDAAQWVRHLRVTRKLVRRTAIAKDDLGAIAYTHSQLKDAKADGIKSGVRFYWQSATAQSVVSQDLLR